MQSFKDSFTNGIMRANPTFILLLGLCPTLAVSTSLDNAVGMTAAVLFVLLLANIIVASIRRFIPEDFRRLNYIVAERLLNESYMAQVQGKPWTSAFWAGQNINNLTESIAGIAQRGELQNIRNVGPVIEGRIRDIMRQETV